MALVFHNAALEAVCVDGEYRVERVRSIAASLHEHGALTFAPLSTGLYPASSATDLGASGYGRVWVRDNVYVALALLESGRPQAAAAVARALMAFYRKHQHRLLAPSSAAIRAGSRIGLMSDSTANRSRRSAEKSGPTHKTTHWVIASGSALALRDGK
jgi:hypothetical protein